MAHSEADETSIESALGTQTGFDTGREVSNHIGPKSTRTDRPCDACRRRKSKCVLQPEEAKCVLCQFHDRPCTFIETPRKRKKIRVEPRRDENIGIPAAMPPTIAQPNQGSAPAVISSQAPDVAGYDLGSTIPADPKPREPAHSSSLLDKTLGLHRTTHSIYTSPSSLQLGAPFCRNGGVMSVLAPYSPNKGFRNVDMFTTFDVRSDGDAAQESDAEYVEAVEEIVRPHGPSLVALYFRIVHPSYPILHKGVWLEKYNRSYKEFSPPLLAAVYALAMDWWDYDATLSMQERPSAERLIAIAKKSFADTTLRPKLSTIQAGLLLLQCSGGASWVLTTQLVALAEELGLHIDCISWNIPDWEKGVRRRLTWAVYMQDKWGAFIHGRPSHITSLGWQISPLELDDFPESARDEDDTEGSTEVETGRRLFIQLGQLTRIMSEVVVLLYRLDQGTNQEILHTQGISGLLGHIKPLALRLKEWAAALPPGLLMEDVKARKLCSNGYLHLSYFATEIMIHRYIVQCVPPDTPDHLVQLCRSAAQARLDRSLTFVDNLRPEHLQGFWWFASPHCLAMIGAFGVLMWATSSEQNEASFYRKRVQDFNWSLKVRAKASVTLAAAVQQMRASLEHLATADQPLASSASLGS